MHQGYPSGRKQIQGQMGHTRCDWHQEIKILQMPTEIVSAEIKLDAAQVITAFGQACSYKLFSHRSCLVVPLDASEDDLADWTPCAGFSE
jgi:hypothetical protein